MTVMTVIKNAFNPEGKYQDMRASDLQDVFGQPLRIIPFKKVSKTPILIGTRTY